MVIIVGFGNALLDYIVHIEDTSILEKHNLNEDDSKEISCNSLAKLLEDVKEKHSWICSSGGSAQNTLCIMKWLLKDQHSMVMFGAIGNDTNGSLLKEIVTSAGVDTMYMTVELQTGLIISLVHQQHRSLVGNIGASALYRKDHATKHIETLKSAYLIYLEGFFLNHGDDIATSENILSHSQRLKKIFAFNLCAVYICEKLPDKVNHFARECDILFGNAREFSALAKTMRFQGDVRKFAGDMSRTRNGKIVVITDGCHPVFCVYGDDVFEVEVPTIDETEVVDTTGAGDAFVAGFLSGHVLGWSIGDSLKAGCWASKQIIKQNGCRPPDVSTDTFYAIPK